MKTSFLVFVFCAVAWGLYAQSPVNPYPEEQDYRAHRAYDLLVHCDHLLVCKTIYKEVKHLTHDLYSSHIYHAEVIACPKGGMIGKGCMITFSEQKEDAHATPEGRYAAPGLVYLGFDTKEVEFNQENKIWNIISDFSFRYYGMGKAYNAGETMLRVMREHPELLDKPQDASMPGAELEVHLQRVSLISSEDTNTRLYRERLKTLLPLLIQGLPVDTTLPETKGNTALHYACALGDLPLVNALLSLGANPNARTHKGATPLRCAGGDSALKIQAVLKQYGAVQ